MSAPLGWSDAALVLMLGGVLGYALGVFSTMAWCLARIRYWRHRAERMRDRWGAAVARCSLLQRQGD